MVQTLRLTKDMVALVDDDDFPSVVGNWHASRSRDKWYAARSLPWRKIGRQWKRPKLYLHRLITDCHDPKLMVDHYDGDSLNCTRKNLMVCAESWNTHNTESRSMSGYRGVRQHRPGIWEPRITYEGEVIYLGHFTEAIEAARAYDAKAIELFGPFARNNVREGRLPPLPKLTIPTMRFTQTRELVDASCPF